MLPFWTSIFYIMPLSAGLWFDAKGYTEKHGFTRFNEPPAELKLMYILVTFEST
jgi:hypothetical protein